MYPMHDITRLYLLLNVLIFVISNLFIGERFSLGVGERAILLNADTPIGLGLH
jgi:hypothetical protein